MPNAPESLSAVQGKTVALLIRGLQDVLAKTDLKNVFVSERTPETDTNLPAIVVRAMESYPLQKDGTGRQEGTGEQPTEPCAVHVSLTAAALDAEELTRCVLCAEGYLREGSNLKGNEASVDESTLRIVDMAPLPYAGGDRPILRRAVTFVCKAQRRTGALPPSPISTSLPPSIASPVDHHKARPKPGVSVKCPKCDGLTVIPRCPNCQRVQMVWNKVYERFDCPHCHHAESSVIHDCGCFISADAFKPPPNYTLALSILAGILVAATVAVAFGIAAGFACWVATIIFIFATGLHK